MYRTILFFVFTWIQCISSLFALNQHLTDSLLTILNNKSVGNETIRYNILCKIAENSADAEDILKYSELAIILAKRLHVSIARPTIFKGVGYLQAGKLSMALESFMHAAEAYKTEDNTIGLATAYSYISSVYISQQNHNNATLYLKKAIEIFSIKKDSIRLASALHNLGYEYYRVDQYDSALSLFLKTSEIYNKLRRGEEYAYCIGNAGLVYSREMQSEKAEVFLLKAIEILNQYGDEPAIAEYMIEYANLLQQKGKINLAIRYAKKSYAAADKNKSDELMRDAAYRLAQLYRSVKNYDSAYYYLTMFVNYSDSIRNYKTIQEMADLRTEFEVSQKQKEVDLLEKEKAIQRIVIGALILILLLAGGLIFVYYKSLRRAQKFSAILDERHKLLEQQSSELKQINRIKDRFFSIISHDLRGPISSLGGISTLLKEGFENDNFALLHEVSDYIDLSVISLAGLLENLLNWALSQQNQLMFKEERIDLKALIEEVVPIFSAIALSKDIQIKLSLSDNLFISADRNSLMSVIRNLLSNAVKFTSKGGKVNISTSLNKEGLAEIWFADNGIGISEDKLNSLFELKGDKSTRGTEKETGIGLGLVLVHEFVAINKGTIKVISEAGKGTSFFLFFPMIK